MPKGRKPEPGTLEAREMVHNGKLLDLLAREENLSHDGCIRIMKAVKFGLGIKPTPILE